MSTEVADLIARLRLDASGFITGATQSAGAVDSLDARIRTFSSSASTVGSTLDRTLTIPILAAVAASVKLATDFQSAFGRIAAETDQPLTALGNLQNAVLSLAQSTAQSPTQLANSLVLIEKSGIPAADAMDVLTAAAKASAAGLGSVQNVADAVTSAMNAYGPANLSAAQAGDILAKAASDGKVTIDDLSQGLGRTLSISAAAGISFSDLAAATATMSREGLGAASASQSLFRIISSIENPTTKGTAALNQLGISLKAAQSAISSGNLLGLLEELASKEQGNTGAIIALTGGIRGSAGAFAAMAQDGQVAQQVFGDVANSSGTLSKQLATVSGTMGFQLKQAFSDLEVSAIKFGDAAAPAIKDFAGAIENVANALSDLPTGAREAIIVFGALLAVLGPALTIAGSLARSYLALQALYGSLTGATLAQSQADQAAATAAGADAAAQSALADALATRSAAQTASQGTLFGSDVGAAGATQGAFLIPTAGVAPVAEVAPEATAATLGFAGALGTLGLAFGAVTAAAAIDIHALQDDGGTARRTADDVHNLVTEMENYAQLKPSDQSKVFSDLQSRVNDAEGALKSYQATVDAAANAVAAGQDPQISTDIGGLGLTQGGLAGTAIPEPAQLVALHTALQQVIADQGALAAKPFFTQFLADVGRLPSAGAIVGHTFDDIREKIDAADAEIKTRTVQWGADVGVGATAAQRAVAQYDSAMSNAKLSTDQTKTAGEQAAVALSALGISAAQAASATVSGMNEADIAVATLEQSLQNALDTTSASNSFLSAVQGIKSAASSGGGGGGSGQTPEAAMLDRAQKELTLRDALQKVADVQGAVTAADTGLAQARETHREALISLQAAETNYKTTLDGVAASSLAARQAVLSLSDAQNSAAGAKLDVADARRNLEQVKTNQPLLAINVRAARTTLNQDIQGGATSDQIIKDQVALRDAEIQASAGADDVKRAQLQLSEAENASKQKTMDLAAAHKTAKDVLDGYSKSSTQAKQATSDLINAQLGVQQSAEGITSAEEGITSAQNDIANSALALQRAQADLAGQLTAASGGAAKYGSTQQAVATATDQAEQAAFKFATTLQKQVKDATGSATEGAAFVVAGLQALENQVNPSGALAQYMNLLIAQFNALASPHPIAPAPLPTTPIFKFPTILSKNAHGTIATRPTIGMFGEAGPEAIVPLGNTAAARADRSRIMASAVAIAPDLAGVPGGTGGGHTYITYINAPITITGTVLGADVEETVQGALQNITDRNGYVPGVRTI